jgi:hypothetical protein
LLDEEAANGEYRRLMYPGRVINGECWCCYTFEFHGMADGRWVLDSITLSHLEAKWGDMVEAVSRLAVPLGANAGELKTLASNLGDGTAPEVRTYERWMSTGRYARNRPVDRAPSMGVAVFRPHHSPGSLIGASPPTVS